MDSSSLGLAWGRLSSHRRARSSDIPASRSGATLPLIAVTSNGTRYMMPSDDATATTTSPPLLKPPSLPQHSRSKSWSTTKEKNHESPSSYKSTLSLPTNPLSSLRRAASSAKRSHKTTSSISSSSISSSWSTSLHGSSSSIDIPAPQKSSPLTSAASTPPQRPPRPPCGLFEDEPHTVSSFASPSGAVEDDSDPMMQGLILKSDQAFAAVSLALADAAYNTHIVTQAAALPTVMRSQSVLLPQKGLGFLASPTTTTTTTTTQPPTPSQGGAGGPLASKPVRRNSLQSSHSTSSNSKGHGAARSQPSTTTTKTKKMGKRNVLLPRKLRLTTITQSVNGLLASRTSTNAAAAVAAAAAKRRSAGSLSSTYSDYTEEDADQPPHKRNSSITAARRQHRPGTSFALCATDDAGTLTASQMYHREMLPNSVAAWMGTGSALADEEDDDATDDQAPSHEPAANEHDVLATSPRLPIQPPPPSAALEGGCSSPPPPPLPPPPPPPPPKNPARFGARARTSHLSPIPEMLVATPPVPEGQRRRRNSSVKISPKSKPGSGGTNGSVAASPRDSLYLVGTAYSQTTPLFRHGHIEFQHKGKVKAAAGAEGCRELVLRDSPQLDWSAFHSSVLCDADDLEAGFAQDEANAMADELSDWFDEFGFESHGALIRGSCAVVPASKQESRSGGGGGRAAPAAPRGTASSRSSASTISDADLPMPARPDRSPSLAKMQGWSFAQAGRHEPARHRHRHRRYASDPIPVAVEQRTSPRGLGLDTYGLPQGGAQGGAPGASKQGGRGRGTRMSCNLSDDLGQFLAWNPTAFDDLDEDDR